MSLWGSKKRDDRGAAVVETALCLCFLVLPLVFATISYGYMLSFRQALSQAASEGARAAVGAPSASAVTSSATTAIENSLSTYKLTCSGGTLTCSISAPTTTGCPSPHTCVTVTVSYPYRAHNLLPTLPGMGFTLPNNLSFTSVVQVS
ncbi:MAG TPA: TadE/TadG family type IV pilus assembly protein [Marmoricola sp.]|jgi:Flp pilus assembly protein TadG|nr:TadE/TadG family type IV pilus assembly protein [Marmoricola sp.]